MHDVLTGSMDLAITTEPPMSPLLSATKIAQAPFYITMAKDDEAASQQQLSMSALHGKEWVLFERHVHPSLYDSVLRVAAENPAPANRRRSMAAMPLALS